MKGELGGSKAAVTDSQDPGDPPRDGGRSRPQEQLRAPC